MEQSKPEIQALVELARRIAAPGFKVPALRELWRGADVEIMSDRLTEPDDGGFYPPDRPVYVDYPGELSWLFIQVRDCLGQCELTHAGLKEEFYGRMGNAANVFDVKYRTTFSGPVVLLLAVIREAMGCVDQLYDGQFGWAPITIHNRIFADINPEKTMGFSTVEEMTVYFAKLGFEFNPE